MPVRSIRIILLAFGRDMVAQGWRFQHEWILAPPLCLGTPARDVSCPSKRSTDISIVKCNDFVNFEFDKLVGYEDSNDIEVTPVQLCWKARNKNPSTCPALLASLLLAAEH